MKCFALGFRGLFLAAALQLAWALGSPVSLRAADDFQIQVAKGDHVAVNLGGKTVAKFMTAHDLTTPEKHHETYKPYLHVFDSAGEVRLTKGAGFSFTHHRGIFLGFSKISYGGKTYDRWHMKGGDQVVKDVSTTGNGFVARIDWHADEAKTFLTEQRGFTFSKPASPFYLGVEMTSSIQTVEGEALFDGDPEHAGAQFRPSEKVDTTTTTYVFPGEKIDAHKVKDLPWAAEIFTVEGNTFTVVILNHPSNPEGTAFSAYRNYGRFGAFPRGKATADSPFKLHYQWLIAKGEVRDPAVFQQAWNKFANREAPVPAVTVLLSEQPKPKAPAAGK